MRAVGLRLASGSDGTRHRGGRIGRILVPLRQAFHRVWREHAQHVNCSQGAIMMMVALEAVDESVTSRALL